MATSFAVALLPLEVDDRAPPMDWRTKENMSHGYGSSAISVASTVTHIGSWNSSGEFVLPSHISRFKV